ncbi:GNAT family N-acetyltransferase [Aquihabitans sp. McL0605]|uniref:GNAT family N-acetyltransferase n=1 Tax=Aquihabitans sp. McL0605 TaxID=3415671 RepID=UPI003CEF3D63
MSDGQMNPRPRPAVSVVDLTTDDLADIARLHLLAFPDSELGRQGTEAVRRSYLWQFEGPHDLTAIGARLDGRLVGFLFGGVFRGSTIGFLKREWPFLVGQAVRHPSTVLRRSSWSRITLALRLLVRRTPQPAPEEPTAVGPRSFGVLSIAVDPTVQGGGVGRAIMVEAERAAREQGFDQMHLTVHPSNEQAVRFYLGGGWQWQIDDDGERSGQMIRLLV